PAMNAPVLNVTFLPVAPARAAIVVFAEEYGGTGLAIGIRSNEGGQVVVFKNQEPLDASVPVADALESGLASAERLGFLFDEDMVDAVPGGQGRSQAMALWGRLMGDFDMATLPRVVPSQPATSESILDPANSSSRVEPPGEDPSLPEIPELVLDDVAVASEGEIPEMSLDLEAAPIADEASSEEVSPKAEPVMPDALRVEPPAAPAALEAAEVPAQTQLSKFRNRAPDASSEDSGEQTGSTTGGGSELGRIPLVRIRREGPKRVPFLARLLSSF
ncbi:MAG: hypothetical protein H8E78_05000, partial [Proteobacteria bacterium]|nr:hypothetical protein [Pseudomonadota bacterium]